MIFRVGFITCRRKQANSLMDLGLFIVWCWYVYTVNMSRYAGNIVHYIRIVDLASKPTEKDFLITEVCSKLPTFKGTLEVETIINVLTKLMTRTKFKWPGKSYFWSSRNEKGNRSLLWYGTLNARKRKAKFKLKKISLLVKIATNNTMFWVTLLQASFKMLLFQPNFRVVADLSV